MLTALWINNFSQNKISLLYLSLLDYVKSHRPSQLIIKSARIIVTRCRHLDVNILEGSAYPPFLSLIFMSLFGVTRGNLYGTIAVNGSVLKKWWKVDKTIVVQPQVFLQTACRAAFSQRSLTSGKKKKKFDITVGYCDSGHSTPTTGHRMRMSIIMILPLSIIGSLNLLQDLNSEN